MVSRPEVAAPFLWWRPTAATFVDLVDVVLGVGLVDVDLDVALVGDDLDIDLVDVDLVDVGLVDVDLVVSLSASCIFIFWPLAPQLYFRLLAFPDCI